MRKRFAFTPFKLADGSVVIRPHLDVVLRYQGENTPRVSVLLDSGSDFCIFDNALAQQMGLNPPSVGRKAPIEGIAGKQDAYVVPVSIFVCGLDLPLNVDAYFCVLQKGLFGVLGHAGFLEHFETCFSRKDHFEITDERPADVVQLRVVKT